MGEDKSKQEKSMEEIEDLDDLLDEDTEALSMGELEGLFQEAAPDFQTSEELLKGADFTLLDNSAGTVGAGKTLILGKIQILVFGVLQKLKSLGKGRALFLGGAIGTFFLLIILIATGLMRPSFQSPFEVSLKPWAKNIVDYDPKETSIPLFDSFRSKAFTVSFPKTVFNLKSSGSETRFGELEFFIELRDKKYEKLVLNRKSETIDRIQRIMEQVTWEELESPTGKEKVKKIVRNRLNKLFQRDIVLSVFYRSLLLSK